MDSPKFKFEKERTFTAQRMGLGGVGKVAALKTHLNGGYHHNPTTGAGVSDGVDTLHEMIATCEVAIVSAPPWWNAREVYDVDLLRQVYEGAVSFRTFREWQDEQEEGGVSVPGTAETLGSGEHKEAGDRGGATPVVDLKVPAAAHK
jgi:hypothetical protein